MSSEAPRRVLKAVPAVILLLTLTSCRLPGFGGGQNNSPDNSTPTGSAIASSFASAIDQYCKFEGLSGIDRFSARLQAQRDGTCPPTLPPDLPVGGISSVLPFGH